MSTGAKASLEEYLTASFDGADPEYIDGRIVPRALPLYSHAKATARLASIFARDRRHTQFFGALNLRLRLAENRIRVADVAVFHEQEPTEQIPSKPPFLVVEIVSPDDRHTDLVKKLEEYRAWGAGHVWLVDPWLRKLSVYDQSGLRTVDRFELRDVGVAIEPGELFD